MTAGTRHIETPTVLGDITVVRDDAGVRGLYFPGHWYVRDRTGFGTRGGDGFDDVVRELGEYLDGRRRDFTVPLAPEGTDFQRRVWRLIAEIPYGETTTYGALAARLGDGADPRDVGAAVGRNPLSILVPCHRVVGSTGKLVGYAGGLERKQHLLDLERAETQPVQQALALDV